MTEDAYDALVGQNVKRLRDARGMTQADLADQVVERGLPFRQQTIVKIEKGQRPLRLREADAIAASLEVDLDVLVDEQVVFDDTVLLINQTERVEALWADLIRLNQDLLDALQSLAFHLDRVGNREGAQTSQAVLNEAATLLQLDPVRIAESARATRDSRDSARAADYDTALDTVAFVRRGNGAE